MSEDEAWLDESDPRVNTPPPNPAPPAPGEHWSKDPNKRKAFFAKIREIGYDHDRAYNTLVIDHLEDWPGTAQEALLKLRQANDERMAAALFTAAQVLPEAVASATSKWMDPLGGVHLISVRAGVPDEVSQLALTQIIDLTTSLSQRLSAAKWQAMYDSRDGPHFMGTPQERAQAEADAAAQLNQSVRQATSLPVPTKPAEGKLLPPPIAGASSVQDRATEPGVKREPVNPVAGTGSAGSNTELMAVAEIERVMGDDGKIKFKVYGGKYRKYGVTMWPDEQVIAPLAALVSVDSLVLKTKYDFSDYHLNAVILLRDGKASKVLSLQVAS